MSGTLQPSRWIAIGVVAAAVLVSQVLRIASAASTDPERALADAGIGVAVLTTLAVVVFTIVQVRSAESVRRRRVLAETWVDDVHLNGSRPIAGAKSERSPRDLAVSIESGMMKLWATAEQAPLLEVPAQAIVSVEITWAEGPTGKEGSVDVTTSDQVITLTPSSAFGFLPSRRDVENLATRIGLLASQPTSAD